MSTGAILRRINRMRFFPGTLLATANMDNEGIGEVLRMHLLLQPFIPITVYNELSVKLSPWAFLQIPMIAIVLVLSWRLILRTKTTPLTRITTMVFIYMATMLVTNMIFGWVIN